MTIIIFSSTLEGHHLEYIHHIYEMAIEDVGHTYIFLLPSSFLEKREKLEWVHSKNVRFDIFEEFREVNTKSVIKRLLGSSYKITRIVAQAVKKYDPDYVYTNLMMGFVPFAPLLIKRQTRLIGIIYRIYLHDIGVRSKYSLFQDRLKYWMMSKFDIFYRLLILNDNASVLRLNKVYNTKKFVPIPDPYIPLEIKEIEDIRRGYGIGENKILFVHFGAMNSNKGTLDLLESLVKMEDEECREYAFFLAGRVDKKIKQRFMELVDKVKGKVQIVVKDDYCSYEFFASLCAACNAIVIPYKRTAQSSGLIGYASQFGKPVIAPAKGLLGQLVREYGLGILIEEVTSENLMAAFQKIAKGNYQKPSKRYCEENTIESFQKTIKNCVHS